LDDPYIHAAIARHIVQDHTFGISPHIFASASSSILWPLLLAACFKLFGVHIIIPLLLNAFFSICILFSAAYFLWKLYPTITYGFLVGLQFALFLATPLLTMTFAGMEHTLHILLTLLFVYLAVIVVSEYEGSDIRSSPRLIAYTRALYVAAFLLVATRYEGAFTVAAIGILFLLQKRVRDCIYVALAGMSAPVIFGIYSVMHGSHFLPNSLLIKADASNIHNLFHPEIIKALGGRYAWLYAPTCLWIVAIICLLSSLYKSEFFSKKSVALFLFVVSFALHLQLARLGWFWRYEAYLVAMAMFAFFFWIADIITTSSDVPLKKRFGFLVVAVLCMLPLLQRIRVATLSILPAIRTIYIQQYQMAQFAREYYHDEPLVANDVGAISFYGNHDVIDIVGLGSVAITNQRIANACTPSSLNTLAKSKHAHLALIYKDWFVSLTGEVPVWTQVGTWKIAVSPHATLGGGEVTFYAIDPQDSSYLKKSLERYDRVLPQEVRVSLH
jgi:hypothetical protein